MSVKALDWAFETPGLSASEKLVLLVYANFSGDACRAYPSNETVARLSGLNAKTARAAIDRLCAAGLLVDTGDRVGRTQQIKVYRLGMETIPETDAFRAPSPRKPSSQPTEPRQAAVSESLPKTDAFDTTAKATVSRPKDSQNRETEPFRNLTPEDADASSAPKGRKKRGLPMAGDWQAPDIENLSEPARSIARQWPAGAYASSASGHRAHMIGSGRLAVDHNALWAARVVQLGAGPIRDGKAGLRFVQPVTRGALAADDVALAIAGYERRGQTDLAEALRRRHAGG